jgi:hypothetical protein
MGRKYFYIVFTIKIKKFDAANNYPKEVSPLQIIIINFFEQHKNKNILCIATHLLCKVLMTRYRLMDPNMIYPQNYYIRLHSGNKMF